MDALVVLIPLMPLVAASAIGIGHLFGVISGEAERKQNGRYCKLDDHHVQPAGFDFAGRRFTGQKYRLLTV